MGLTEYRQKRDFKKTSEPGGERSKPGSKSDLFFVVQKHAASRLHYDLRLHLDGVLKSWAVPKGFPLRKGERRLAVQVEDHPVDYARFEGTIPPGNYGAGTVMVWDLGNYSVQGDDPKEALKKGKLHLKLSGKKLKGEWALIRMRDSNDAAKSQWLLLKIGEDAPPISPRAEDQSVLTKRSMEQIAADNDAQWESDRPATRDRKAPRATPASAEISKHPSLKNLPRATPGFISPMKALLVDELPKGPDWVYEVKFDGYRALGIRNGRKLSLMSRNAKDLTDRYREISEALERLPSKQFVLDGEVVAVDRHGRSSFQLLQSYQTAGKAKPPLFYYAFDVLNLEGRSVLSLPLSERKDLLQSLLADGTEPIRFSASMQGDASKLVKEMKKRGLEGLIAKLKHSRYEPGKRSGSWQKYKWNYEQEFVIGGYTPPKGTRPFFGAILVGYYENKPLLFASKVGAGFDRKLLESLFNRFQELIRPDCPFANLPERRPGGITAAEMKKCTWLEPKLVCQIRFTEWTRDNHLRHPVFLGLREDKDPKEVVRERPA